MYTQFKQNFMLSLCSVVKYKLENGCFSWRTWKSVTRQNTSMLYGVGGVWEMVLSVLLVDEL